MLNKPKGGGFEGGGNGARACFAMWFTHPILFVATAASLCEITAAAIGADGAVRRVFSKFNHLVVQTNVDLYFQSSLAYKVISRTESDINIFCPDKFIWSHKFVWRRIRAGVAT